VPLSGFRLGQFPIHWDKMHAEVSQAKLRRYVELNTGFYDAIFKPVQYGGNQDKVCGVCGIESEGVVGGICQMCSSFDTEIGKNLPQARFVALGLGQPNPDQQSTAYDVLQSLGVQIQWIRDEKESVGSFKVKPQRVILWALDDPGYWPSCNLPAVHWLHYTVNQIPPKSFDELQKEAHGIERLGVLRMDVDNLGNAFKYGFGEGEGSIASLARVSALSMQIGLFFDGWIKRICEEQHDRVYTVYAGGDDVFLISPWNDTPLLARRIAGEFANYVHHLPALHVSAGMSFIHGKYPVYQAATDAGEALQQAKSKDGKNAFNFLGETWTWGDFDLVHQCYEHLLKLVSPEKDGGVGAPQALLQLLQQLRADQKRIAGQSGSVKPVFGPYLWMGDYHFARRVEAAKSPVKEMLKTVHKDLQDNTYGSLPLWSAAARWVQLYVRAKKSKSNQEDQ